MCNKHLEHDTWSRMTITFSMSQICFVSKIIVLCLKFISRLYLQYILENLLLQMPCFSNGTEWIVMLNERGKNHSLISMDSISFNCKIIYLIWTTSRIYSLNILIYTEYSWEHFTPCPQLSIISLLANTYCLLCTRHWVKYFTWIHLMLIINLFQKVENRGSR